MKLFTFSEFSRQEELKNYKILIKLEKKFTKKNLENQIKKKLIPNGPKLANNLSQIALWFCFFLSPRSRKEKKKSFPNW